MNDLPPLGEWVWLTTPNGHRAEVCIDEYPSNGLLGIYHAIDRQAAAFYRRGRYVERALALARRWRERVTARGSCEED